MSAGEIVIVDDNPTNLTLLAGILEAAGYTVRATNSGKRVQKLVEADPPELVMLDVQMPDVDGYEVCRRLKADDATRSIPVMFISALDGVLDKVEAFNAGAVDYVTKPFHADEVIARVESQLKVFRLQRQLEERNAELQRMYEDLVAANRKAERVFSALSDVLPGTVLDDTYRLDARIGQGAFGAVFRAEHLSLQRAVAVKVLRPTADNDAPEAVERFRVEGIAACRLNHPNAVDVIDFGVSASGIAYLVMELLRGYTLGWVLKQRGLLPLDRCVEIMLPVCDVLAEAHALDILHRDVKPENVFLHQTRRGEVVKVVDFGLAKLMRDRMSGGIDGAGAIVGTPKYMAPERFVNEDEYGGSADIYSVGVMLYRMLSGCSPFPELATSTPHAIALQRLTVAPRPLAEVMPDLPPAVAAVVMRALDRDPAARPTARELAGILATDSHK